MPLPLPLPLPLTLLFSTARNASANGLLRGGSVVSASRTAALVARFSASPSAALKKHEMPPRPKPPPDSEIEESYLKGSGPGGQKIVSQCRDRELFFIPSPSLRNSDATYLLNVQLTILSLQNKTSSAVQLKHIPTGVVVKSQATRSRSQNRKIARELLAQKLDDMRNGDHSRSAIVGEVKRKKAASAVKKSKRKYRKLEEEKDYAAKGDNGVAEAELSATNAEAREQPVEERTNDPSVDAKP